MSILTLITLAVVVAGASTRMGYGRALALGGATPAGAALVFGATAVPTFYAVSLGAAVALAVHLLGYGRAPARERLSLPPGALLLLLFLGWSLVVTLVAPMLFDGMPIVTPGAPRLVAGVITSSNVAQLTYLFLGLCVVVFLARSPSARPELVGLAVGLCTLLSFWRYLAGTAGLPFPEGVFDNSTGFAFIETAAGGVDRFRGILSEPSSLAGTSLVTIAYMLPRAAQVTGWRRVGALLVAGIALFLGVISTAATFVVAGLVTAALMVLAGGIGFLARRYSVSRAMAVVGGLGLVAAVWALPAIVTFVGSTVNDKLVSTSYTERSSANSDSFVVFLDSYGLGVGLGSARASSFAPTLLSATGVIGALLFTAAVAVLIRRGWRVQEYRPVVWALIAVLVLKLTAGPDLSDSSGVMWIALGLLSHAALRSARAVRAGPHSADDAHGGPLMMSSSASR